MQVTMKIASKIEVNIILVVVFVFSGLLVIDFFVPKFVYEGYLSDFRAVNSESLGDFISFASEYKEKKTYFVGDSIFWGDGLEKDETIPAYFEDCTGRESFNLALSGMKIRDLNGILNKIPRDGQIVYLVNAQSFLEYRGYPNLTIPEESLVFSARFPYLYSQRHLIQESIFGKSTKKYVYEKYESVVKNKTHNFDLPLDKDLKFYNEVYEEYKRLDKQGVIFVIPRIFNAKYDARTFYQGNYIDFSNAEFPKDRFLDVNHFSKLGSKEFAEKLCEVLK
ncbi:MAG: hypothetical protein WC595_05575 [Candidatus Nanoarchaeia archaeon]